MAKHPPAVYISPQDQANLQAQRATSWQVAQRQTPLRKAGESGCDQSLEGAKKKSRKKLPAALSAEDLRLLAELPPHYHPGNQ